MQVIRCLKFCNVTESGGQYPAPNSGGTYPPRIYAHAHSAWQWHPETAARGDREKV